MTKYYSKAQVRKMLKTPALETDENKKFIQLTGEQIFNFKRAIEHLYWETGEEDTLIDLLKTLGIEYDSHTYWN